MSQDSSELPGKLAWVEEAYEGLPDGLLCATHSGSVLYVNPRLDEMVEADATMWPGQSLEQVWPFPDLAIPSEPGSCTEHTVCPRDQRTLQVERVAVAGLDLFLFRDISDRRRQEKTLKAITSCTATEGVALFHSVVQALTELLGVRFGLVGELYVRADGEPMVRALAFSKDGEVVDNFSYELAGSPCETVIHSREMCRYSHNTYHLFPRDPMLKEMGIEGYAGVPVQGPTGTPLGLILGMDTRPLRDVPEAHSILQLLATRVGAEIARMRAERERAEHVRHLESLQWISDIVTSTSQVDELLQRVLDALRVAFKADQVWFLYPCDPEAEEYHLVLQAEHDGDDTSPVKAGIVQRSPALSKRLADVLAADDPFCGGPSEGAELAGLEAASSICFAVDVRAGSKWLLCIQCFWEREWTLAEQRLGRDIASRVADALGNLLLFESIEASEERYRNLVNSLHEVIFQTDREGRMTFVNAAWSAITRYSTRAAIGEPFSHFVHTDDRTVFSAALDRLRNAADDDDGFATIQMRLLTIDGDVRWTEATVTQNSARDGFSGTLEDLTDRKRAELELLESEQRYRRLVERSPQAMAVFCDGSLLFANQAAVTLFGAADRDQLLEQDLYSLLPPTVQDRFDVMVAALLGEPRSTQEPAHQITEETIGTLDGRTVEVELLGTFVLYEDQPAVQIIFRNLTARREAERALRDSEERYALAALGSNDGLWDWNLGTRAIYYSPRWLEILGLQAAEVPSLPESWFNRVHPDDTEELNATLQAHLRGETPYFKSEHRIAHKDGSFRWVHCRGVAVTDRDGSPRRMAGSLRDITERKEAQDLLIYNALHDGLTGLPNRTRLTKTLEVQIANTDETAGGFAVVILDFDRFKLVNDSLGHSVGDALLLAISKRLIAQLRDSDMLARLGGDEFGIILTPIEGLHDAEAVANRIHGCLSIPFVVDGNEIFSSASMGIAMGGKAADRPETLLRDADTAMYRAKALGRSRHIVFDTGMREAVQGLLRLETDLRKGIDGRQFVNYYQPILDLQTERLLGFEALVRWNHPQRGLVGPQEFISLAEETGLIRSLGLRVLQDACAQLASWRRAFPQEPELFVCVNLSARQLGQTNLAEVVAGVLEQAGLPAASLKLELTETILLDHPELTSNPLEELRAIGVPICIDDFGTGYSSLSYLHNLPIHTLKIDRSFVARIGGDGSNDEVVPTIINLAHSLGINVVAEGIETPYQLECLQAYGCDQGQGYLFARPIPFDKTDGYLHKVADGEFKTWKSKAV